MDISTFVDHLKTEIEYCERFELNPHQPYQGQIESVGPTGVYPDENVRVPKRTFRVFCKDGSQFYITVEKYE